MRLHGMNSLVSKQVATELGFASSYSDLPSKQNDDWITRRIARQEIELDSTETKVKHLELIQGVVNRLASDSFSVKRWTVLLVAASFVLMARMEGAVLVGLSMLFVTIVFWFLDGYFLWQERLYRKIYDHVRVQESENTDFSMNTGPFRRLEKCTWLSATFSLTLAMFYGVLGFANAMLIIFHV